MAYMRKVPQPSDSPDDPLNVSKLGVAIPGLYGLTNWIDRSCRNGNPVPLLARTNS
jgi:hypothetical protein